MVRGTVQGVGFRPFVYGLAQRYRLGGFVRNESGAVRIEIEGIPERIDEFLRELRCAPPLAHISALCGEDVAPRNECEFRIESSIVGAQEPVSVSPDVATCPECLAELFDPLDRRFEYPFINCTNCGPRLTIIQSAPYDRRRTTMAGFAMCPQCRREYEDPADRRFHAEPVACPVCGPRLELCQPNGEPIAADAPFRLFVDLLKRGGIGALKGLGGYHLACDATNARAVSELRRRKHRDEKPLAIMVRDLAAVERLCILDRQERELLESPPRPIVLLRKRPEAATIVAQNIAPGNPCLGVMLPYAPLHHLILEAMGAAPLVMTSGNSSDEPIAYLDDDALKRLGHIAEIILRHDRPIHVRCDDSVTRCVAGQHLLVRRSRGYAPAPIRLPSTCVQPVLAVGGQLKVVFGLGVGEHAMISHHVGDLDHFEAYRQFTQDITLYERLFAAPPQVIVHDLHPGYASTRYAEERAASGGLSILAVQHHHAHMASCMAENDLAGPVIGVTLDGTGFGIDEATQQPVVWGGEFLVGDYRQFRRAAHLRYVPMPGGDKAAREPWRMAAAQLADARCDQPLLAQRISPIEQRTIAAMLARRFNAPLTSSAGRLFDAVASIAGVRDYASYEGQAAMELEWLADGVEGDGAYPFAFVPGDNSSEPGEIDTRPLIRAAAADAMRGVAAARIARRFHTTLTDIIREVCCRIGEQTGLDAVVLSGGVFMNALLVSEVHEGLNRAGLRVYRHRLLPPNDGGLSFGQLAIAATKLSDGGHSTLGRSPKKPAACNTNG
jgi:hydrogenase maturation protein HypF